MFRMATFATPRESIMDEDCVYSTSDSDSEDDHSIAEGDYSGSSSDTNSDDDGHSSTDTTGQ